LEFLWQSNRGQAGAATEGPIPNAGDTVGDTDRGQTAALIKGFLPNAGITLL